MYRISWISNFTQSQNFITQALKSYLPAEHWGNDLCAFFMSREARGSLGLQAMEGRVARSLGSVLEMLEFES